MTGTGKEGKGQFLNWKYSLFLHHGRWFSSFGYYTESLFTSCSTQKIPESKQNFKPNPPEDYTRKRR